MSKRLAWMPIAVIVAAAGVAALAILPTKSIARSCSRGSLPVSAACRLVVAGGSKLVSSVTGTSAALSMTVLRGGGTAFYGFQYGTGSPFADTAPAAASASSRSGTVVITTTIADLKPHTLYRFVAYARSARGWSYTDVASFRTAAAGDVSEAPGAPTAVTPTAPTAPAHPAHDTATGGSSPTTATTATTATTTAPPDPTASTPSGPTWLWGAQIGTQFTGSSAPWDMNAVSDFATMVGKAPSVVPFNIPFENCDDPGSCYWYDFPATQMSNVTDYGALTMLNWSSMSIPESTSEPAFTLADVANGDYDSYIRQFAAGAAAWGHPFLLRFDWEMNGNWFPWDAGANGNDAADFVAAWRHVHDIFTAEGATNASWVWCPNVDFENVFTPLNQLYPGSAYVDWTCLDGYNFGNLHGPGGWMSFNQIFSSTYDEVAALAPDKPMIIGETASSETGGSKAAWITDMFNELPHYPNIHGLVYYDQYDGNSDWPLETSQSAIAAFTTGIGSPAFTTNTYADAPDTTITAPGGS